jgi:hypothetical protein
VKRPAAARSLGYKYSLELAQLHNKQHSFGVSELQAARYLAADQIEPSSHHRHSNAASKDIQLSLGPAPAALMGSEARKRNSIGPKQSFTTRVLLRSPLCMLPCTTILMHALFRSFQTELKHACSGPAGYTYQTVLFKCLEVDTRQWRTPFSCCICMRLRQHGGDGSSMPCSRGLTRQRVVADAAGAASGVGEDRGQLGGSGGGPANGAAGRRRLPGTPSDRGIRIMAHPSAAAPSDWSSPAAQYPKCATTTALQHA